MSTKPQLRFRGKLYSLKYVDELPADRGGQALMWRIEILKKYEGDVGLLAHELVHVAQWWAWVMLALAVSVFSSMAWAGFVTVAALGPFLHGALYKWGWYRRWSEILAYRVQLKVGDYEDGEFAVRALVGHGVGEEEARWRLG